MDILAFLIYIATGAFSGLLAGLLGISGGVITVPALLFVFRHSAFPQTNLMHLAIGTSLASMVFNALSAAWFQQRKKAILWPIVQKIFVGIILGCLIGSYFSSLLPEAILETIFGLFACVMAFYLWRAKKGELPTHQIPNLCLLNGIGVAIGAISNILGIGGGIMMVPVLLSFHVHERPAIATSVVTGFIITLFGALFYLYLGVGKVDIPGCIGYIYIPAFIVISCVTLITAPFGVMLAHRLSPPLLKRLFAIMLLLIGVWMVL